MTPPNLLQTQFLKRHITMEPREIPSCGPFIAVSIDTRWFTRDENNCLTITPLGIKTFWSGVKHHGIYKVMSKPNTTGPTNTPPSGGSPVAVAA